MLTRTLSHKTKTDLLLLLTEHEHMWDANAGL